MIIYFVLNWNFYRKISIYVTGIQNWNKSSVYDENWALSAGLRISWMYLFIHTVTQSLDGDYMERYFCVK